MSQPDPYELRITNYQQLIFKQPPIKPLRQRTVEELAGIVEAQSDLLRRRGYELHWANEALKLRNRRIQGQRAELRMLRRIVHLREAVLDWARGRIP